MAGPARKSDALWVIRRLARAGHRALLAGGCVRDMLLGRRPSDYDVATDATPRQVRRLFARVLLVGAKFGVAMVIRDRRTVEVATFRRDDTYSDGRRPDRVHFCHEREDALRRDFTVNGMFYDPRADEVLDYVGGRRDLERRVIRTIGSPAQRFGEDYLRMLRAVRFAERLGFAIEPATARAVRNHAAKIQAVSGERICDELTKMLSAASAPAALARLEALGLTPHVLAPLWAQPPAWQAGRERVDMVAGRRDARLALAALLADLDAPGVRRLTRHWGAANDLRDSLLWLGKHLPCWASAAAMPLANLKRLMAHPQWPRLRILWRVEERRTTGRQTQSRRLTRRLGTIDPKRIAPPPWVTGDDLQAMGLVEGPRLGRILRAVYDAQLNETVATRAAARRLAQDLVDGDAE